MGPPPAKAAWQCGHKLPAQPPDAVRWLEAVVEPAASASTAGLVLQLPGGVRLELTHASQAGLLVSLIRALERPPC